MIVGKKDDISIKEIKKTIKEKIRYIILEENCQENEIEEFLLFYTKIIKGQSVSNNIKIILSQIFFDEINLNIYEWLISFLSSAILKIYKNNDVADDNLLINNNYFLFKFLANKEIIKNLITRSLMLSNYNIYIFMHSMSLFPESKQSVENYSKSFLMIEFFFNNYYSFFNKEKDSSMYSIYYALNIKKDLILNQDETISIINDDYFFIKNNEKITINDKFKKFIYLYFSFIVNDFEINLNSKEEEKIKQELKKNIPLIIAP
jgi:hypothetical protein